MVNNMLFIERPLVVNPQLAEAIGLNEAIVLQQCHYWQQKSKYEHCGSRWFYKTGEQWRDELPFWSVPTIRRTIDKLESLGLLVSAQLHGELLNNSHNRTKWYTVNQNHKSLLPCDQSDHMTSDQIDHFSIESNKETTVYGSKSLLTETVEDLDPASWSEWLDYKSKIRDKYKTERGELIKAKSLVKLSKESGIEQSVLVNTAIDNEWKGFHVPKNLPTKPQPQNFRPRMFGE